jgi:hypothetical protein
VESEAYKKLRSVLQARERSGFTQAALAQSFVSKYERGERRLDVIEFREFALAIRSDPIRLLRKLYTELE